MHPDRSHWMPAGKNVKNRRTDIRRYSDGSRSSSSSESVSDSDSNATYSDTNIDPSSISSGCRWRCCSVYHLRNEKSRKKGYFIVNAPRRRSPTAYVPKPQCIWAQSHERSTLSVIGSDRHIAKPFATDVVAATHAAAVADRLPKDDHVP
jgi:hypothetical protein